MKRLFLLFAACTATFAAMAQVRFVDAADLNLIGQALPTSHPYHRIDTTVYKGFTPEENQQVRCSAGLAVTFKTDSPRIDVWATYNYARRGDNTAGISDAMVFDAFSNPSAQMIRERLIPFIARIREKLPTTPLIFCVDESRFQRFMIP